MIFASFAVALSALALLLHAGMPFWERLIGMSLGCGVPTDECGAAGRMAVLWFSGLLPISVIVVLSAATTFSAHIRRCGPLGWAAIALAGAVPASGVPQMSVWLAALALMAGSLSGDGARRLSRSLTALAASTAVIPLFSFLRALLVPLAGVNAIPRASATELSVTLRDIGESSASALSSPWTAAVVALVLYAWSISESRR